MTRRRPFVAGKMLLRVTCWVWRPRNLLSGIQTNFSKHTSKLSGFPLSREWQEGDPSSLERCSSGWRVGCGVLEIFYRGSRPIFLNILLNSLDSRNRLEWHPPSFRSAYFAHRSLRNLLILLVIPEIFYRGSGGSSRRTDITVYFLILFRFGVSAYKNKK